MSQKEIQMDTKFPKKIFVTATSDFNDEPNGSELFIAINMNELNEEGNDVEVAVYELVKVGTIKHTVKVVFE